MVGSQYKIVPIETHQPSMSNGQLYNMKYTHLSSSTTWSTHTFL